jgi:tetratricopeptide (TPR) repeat protein
LSSKEIFALRKQGRSAEALKMARAEHPQNASDIWSLRAYAWALYDHAKELVERYEAKQLSPKELSGQFSPYMREFARMAQPLRGDSAFSQMLRLANVVSRDWPEFLGFARWAGIDDFADKDKQPFVNEQGKSVDSLQKQFVRAICRETEARAADSQANPEWVEWGKGILEQALQADSSDQWLNYYQSKLHLTRGEQKQAIERLVPVLLRQSGAAWPWALLGSILEATRPDDSLTCYAHATQRAREEQEVAKVRIHLAQRLALAGRHDEAALQASLAQQYRQENGFKVPQELQQLLSSEWYQRAEAQNRFKRLPKVEGEARALLRELTQQNLIYTRGVIDHVNGEKALSYVATGAETGCGLPHRKFPDVAKLLPGTVVEIGRSEPEGPALGWRMSEDQSVPGLCETFSGTLERQEGKDFAFVRTARADIFVPPPLARDFADGRLDGVTCLAIWRKNKHGKLGWRAIRLSGPDERSSK